jgi:hypothetical protein
MTHRKSDRNDAFLGNFPEKKRKSNEFLSVFCRETVEIFGDFFVQNHDDCVFTRILKSAARCIVL